MRELSLHLPRGAKAQYLRVAEALRQAIRDGQLAPGEALPSSRELAARLRVHRQTVMAALAELSAEGWTYGRERRDYRVSTELPSQFSAPAPAAPRPAVAKPFHFRIARVPELPHPTIPFDRKRHKAAFPSGQPDLRLFPENEFRGFVSAAMRRHPKRVLDYGPPEGDPLFLDGLATYLRRVRAVQDRTLVATNGSQEGIFLTAQLLVGEGDAVGVEAMGYPPAFAALKAAGAKLVPIPIDEGGLDSDALAKVLARRKLKLLYLTPLHQYPTTATLSVGRRAHIYDLCLRHGVAILEDDYDHEFHYRCQPLPPFAANDPAGLVIYVSTFSKVLFPAARLGFVAIPPALAAPFTTLRRIASRQNDGLIQTSVALWMKDGGFERHLRRMRRAYEARRDALVEALQSAAARGAPFKFRVPDGGMAIWVETPGVNADEIAQRAGALGLLVLPGSHYAVPHKRVDALRLGFASRTPQELATGVALLETAVTSR